MEAKKNKSKSPQAKEVELDPEETCTFTVNEDWIQPSAISQEAVEPVQKISSEPMSEVRRSSDSDSTIDLEATLALKPDAGETLLLDEDLDKTKPISLNQSGNDSHYPEKAASKSENESARPVSAEIPLQYMRHVIDESQAEDDVNFKRRIGKSERWSSKQWGPIVIILSVVAFIILLAFLFLHVQKQKTIYDMPQSAVWDLTLG